MAAIDFPSGPADGQLFNAPNGTVYRWSALRTAWLASPINVAAVASPTYDNNAAMLTDPATGPAGTNAAMQITQGQAVFTRTFTALNPANAIEVDCRAMIGANSSAQGWVTLGLFIDGVAACVAQFENYTYVAEDCPLYWQGVLSAGPHNFHVRFGGNTTVYLNGYNGTPIGAGTQRTTMVIRELGGGVQGPPGNQGAAGMPGGAACTSGPTPPASPTPNTLWFYTDGSAGGGALYIWYDDGNSQQWVPVSPAATAGTGLLQTQSFETGAYATGSVLIPADDTIPQITEGNEFMTLAFTPKNAASQLKITTTSVLAPAGASQTTVALFQDALANALAATVVYQAGANYVLPIVFTHVMPSGSTASRTFHVRAGCNTTQAIYFNGAAGARQYGGSLASSIVVQEFM